MAGTRALFASIGASVTLVAAAALSLLAVSAVFAFGGWSDSISDSVSKPALIFAGSTLSQPGAGDASARIAAAPLVVRPPARESRRAAAAPSGGRPSADRARQRSLTNRPAHAAPPTTAPSRPTRPLAPQPPPPPVARKQSTADHVRKVGADLSATVQSTGTALSQVTQPLAPPVSTAVQKVLNVVAELLTRSTGALGGTLDTVLPQK